MTNAKLKLFKTFSIYHSSEAPVPKKEIALKSVTIFSAYLLIVWGFYRFLFKLPEEVEELLIKPVIWLVPLFFILKREKAGLESLGIMSKNLFPSVYVAISLGIIFVIEGVIINFVKYETFDFSANLGPTPFFIAFLLSLATAISEEISFRGYIFNRTWFILGKEWTANFITSFVWGLIHIPISMLWWDLSFIDTLGYFILITLFGIGSSFVFARTRNVTSSILLHVFWEWPIILFR